MMTAIEEKKRSYVIWVSDENDEEDDVENQESNEATQEVEVTNPRQVDVPGEGDELRRKYFGKNCATTKLIKIEDIENLQLARETSDTEVARLACKIADIPTSEGNDFWDRVKPKVNNEDLDHAIAVVPNGGMEDTTKKFILVEGSHRLAIAQKWYVLLFIWCCLQMKFLPSFPIHCLRSFFLYEFFFFCSEPPLSPSGNCCCKNKKIHPQPFF